MNTWLWPDKVIGKKESRKLREEHNDLVNLNTELLDALRVALAIMAKDIDETDEDIEHIHLAIKKARATC